MESAEASINTLLRQKATDEEAIAGLMSTVRELRQSRGTNEAKISSLTQDLEDTGKELAVTAAQLVKLVRGTRKMMGEGESVWEGREGKEGGWGERRDGEVREGKEGEGRGGVGEGGRVYGKEGKKVG
jgi:uncharacterized coiled-coil protein SlyX